jgi:hypothetical protein
VANLKVLKNQSVYKGVFAKPVFEVIGKKAIDLGIDDVTCGSTLEIVSTGGGPIVAYHFAVEMQLFGYLEKNLAQVVSRHHHGEIFRT